MADHNDTPRGKDTVIRTDASGDSRPLSIRLRKLLKLALSGLQLRCVSIVDSDGREVQS